MADSVYSLEHITTGKGKLREFGLTPRTRFSRQQAVVALIEDFEFALERHPYDEVAEKLKDWGIEITAGTLKQYVNTYRREHCNEDAGSTRKRSGKKKAKKGTSNEAVAMAQSVADGTVDKTAEKTPEKTTNGDDEKSSWQSANRSASNRNKRTSNRTPDGFLEMAEDL